MITKVKVNRAFLYKGIRREPGTIVELPLPVAQECAVMGRGEIIKEEPMPESKPETVEEVKKNVRKQTKNHHTTSSRG